MQTLNSANFGATLADASRHLTNLEPFHTGTFSASWESDPNDTEEPALYVVRSYGVAIAGDTGDGFSVVFSSAYNYSATTSKHANIVKKAWGL